MEGFTPCTLVATIEGTQLLTSSIKRCSLHDENSFVHNYQGQLGRSILQPVAIDGGM